MFNQKNGTFHPFDNGVVFKPKTNVISVVSFLNAFSDVVGYNDFFPFEIDDGFGR